MNGLLKNMKLINNFNKIHFFNNWFKEKRKWLFGNKLNNFNIIQKIELSSMTKHHKFTEFRNTAFFS